MPTNANKPSTTFEARTKASFLIVGTGIGIVLQIVLYANSLSTVGMMFCCLLTVLPAKLWTLSRTFRVSHFVLLGFLTCLLVAQSALRIVSERPAFPLPPETVARIAKAKRVV